ncbi:MAG: hypothetical protein JNL82_26135 [Myxococcales bacterium]|nr:hypothetical protein [Myxococcales bacterium]
MFEIRVLDIDRLRVARGRPGRALVWSPSPWFTGVHALAAVAGPAGLTRLSSDLRRCQHLAQGGRGAPLVVLGERPRPRPDRPARRTHRARCGPPPNAREMQ